MSVTIATLADRGRHPDPRPWERHCSPGHGTLGPHVAGALRPRRRPAAHPARGVRLDNLDEASSTRPCAATSSTAAPCAARCAAWTACSTPSGTPRCGPRPRRCERANVQATRVGARGVPARRGGAGRLHLLGGGGRAPRGRAPPRTRRPPSTRAAHDIPYVAAKREAEIEALRSRRAGCRWCRQPGARARPRRPLPLLDRVRASLPDARHPGLRGRRDQRRLGRRRRRAPARRRARGPPASATSSATATTRSTACSPTSAGCRGSSPRR